MTCLLDTHFVIWILAQSSRLKRFSWLKNYEPWGISPISLLELQILAESGRIKLSASLLDSVAADPRFVIDEIPLMTLTRKALDLSWTKDPFDRLIAAHSLARRIPLCSVDENIIENHPLIVRNLH
jgi:PIN domain nuclease of toxin-antitoxin system